MFSSGTETEFSISQNFAQTPQYFYKFCINCFHEDMRFIALTRHTCFKKINFLWTDEASFPKSSV